MTFKTSYNAALGVPSLTLAGVDTTAKMVVGTVVKGFDDLQGEADFIYLPGVAGTLAGDVVTFDLMPGGQLTVRATTASANTGRSIAVALTAVSAGSFGWYQITGAAIVNAVAGTVAGGMYLSATAGSVTSTAAAGVQVGGARINSALGVPAAGQVYATLNRPAVQTQIT